MSDTQGNILLAVMTLFVTFVAAGWLALSRIYTRLGYPPTPEWARSIRLSDDMETIHDKARAALDDDYTITHHDDTRLVLEKEFVEPPCMAKFEAWRGGRWGGGSGQNFSVRCPNHRWLNRYWSSWRNW